MSLPTSRVTKPVSHLLVDLDGTLVSGDRFAMRWAFISKAIATWKDRGGAFKTIYALHQMRKAVETTPNDLTNDVRMIRAFAQVFKLSEVEARTLLEAAVHKIFPTLGGFFAPIEGAIDFIHWAKLHYPLILATNPIWIPEAVELRVRWAGLDPGLFQSFTHAKRMHSCKPRLEYYQELLEQENLDPSSCLLIGNDRRKDLPARHLGIRVFLLTEGAENQSSSQALSTQPGLAPAWVGGYQGLKGLLESSCDIPIGK